MNKQKGLLFFTTIIALVGVFFALPAKADETIVSVVPLYLGLTLIIGIIVALVGVIIGLVRYRKFRKFGEDHRLNYDESQQQIILKLKKNFKIIKIILIAIVLIILIFYAFMFFDFMSSSDYSVNEEIGYGLIFSIIVGLLLLLFYYRSILVESNRLIKYEDSDRSEINQQLNPDMHALWKKIIKKIYSSTKVSLSGLAAIMLAFINWLIVIFLIVR